MSKATDPADLRRLARSIVVVTVSLVCAIGSVSAQSTLSDDRVVALCGKDMLRASELEDLVSGKLMRLKAEEYRLKRIVVDQWIASRLLEQAASERDLTVEAFLRAEVDDRVPEVSDVEARAVIESSGDRFRDMPISQAITSVQQDMRQRRVAKRKQDVLAALQQATKVEVYLHQPRVAVATFGRPSKGPSNAPITIVVFADFECPYCSRLKPVLDRLLTDFSSSVRVVHRHFPLENHVNAIKAAEAAECASQQNQFWQMHDLLFANQRQLQPGDLKRYAGSLGLNQDQFAECLDSSTGAPIWQHDKNDAESYGVSGTPTLFVNGRMLPGLVTFDVLAHIVREELKKLNVAAHVGG
jgi:protein-disulfide isomerase